MSAHPPPPDEPPPVARGGAWKLLLRLAIGLAVIGVLLARTDLDELRRSIANARPGWILGALGVILAGLGVSALRWQAFLRPLGLALEPRTLLRLYFVGTFFNAFLPTGVGGDAYKMMRLRRGPHTLGPALASVMLDRLAGIIGLGIIGLVAVMPYAWDGELFRLDSYRGRAVTIGAVLAAGVLAGAAVLLAGGERLMFRLGRGDAGFLSRARRTMTSFREAGRHPVAFALGVWWGLVFQGLVLGSHLLLARALGIDVPTAAMALVVVMASIATLMPTPNGIGFREAAYKWGLGAFGVSSGPAVAFAFLVLGMLLAASAAGGLVYMAFGGEVRPHAFRSPL